MTGKQDTTDDEARKRLDAEKRASDWLERNAANRSKSLREQAATRGVERFLSEGKNRLEKYLERELATALRKRNDEGHELFEDDDHCSDSQDLEADLDRRRVVARLAREHGMSLEQAEKLAELQRRTRTFLELEYFKLTNRRWAPWLAPSMNEDEDRADYTLEKESVGALNKLVEAMGELRAIHRKVHFGSGKIAVPRREGEEPQAVTLDHEPTGGAATSYVAGTLVPTLNMIPELNWLVDSGVPTIKDLMVDAASMGKPLQRFAYRYIRDRAIAASIADAQAKGTSIADVFFESAGIKHLPEAKRPRHWRLDSYLAECPNVEVTTRELGVAWLLSGVREDEEGEIVAWTTWPTASSALHSSEITPKQVLDRVIENSFKKRRDGAADVARDAVERARHRQGEKKS